MPVVSGVLGALIDTAQMKKVLEFSDIFYHKRFILEKEDRVYHLFENNNFVIDASRNTAPSFEKQESVLDEMAKFVEIFIILPRMFSAFPWRNDRYHSLVNRLEDDCVRIIASICQKIFCLKSLDQPRCNCAIRCGTRSDKESHRHTMRIHGQMYLGVEPPFVRPIA